MDTDLTFMASDWLHDAYFNTSEDRFALIPSRDDDPLRLQGMLETLLRQHAQTTDLDEKNEIVGHLMDMHRQGLILWPIGALWGRSPMGEINEQRFARSVMEYDPGLHDIRTTIAETKIFEESKWTKRERDNRSFALWKLVAALHFSGEGINGPDLIEEVHLLKMAEVFKDGGKWKPWVPDWTKKNVRYLAKFLGALRKDGLFAVALLQDARGSTQAARLTDILEHAPHLRWLEECYEAWINEQRVLTKSSYRDGLRLLLAYLAGLPDDPSRDRLDLLSEKTLRPILDFAKKWSSPASRPNAVAKLQRFCVYMSDRSANDGERRQLGLSNSDVDRFTAETSRALPRSSSPHSEVRARPMPPRFHQMLKDIILENDFAWAKSLKEKRSDTGKHYFTWFDPETGTAKPVFCEVLPRLLLAHLDLPLRNVQIRRLDSGEGDSRFWSPDAGWSIAAGPHAGHWDRERAKNTRRGVIREIQTLSGSITGFYVNTNKTQDSGDSFGETSGYEIPWQHEEALQNFAQMRAWQEKYNPVQGPIEHRFLPKNTFDDEPSTMVSHWLPDRFYLFRYPSNSFERGNEIPVSYKVFYQFFHDALAELERRLLAEDPDFPVKIITGWAGDSPKSAIFTIHGMRAANLTALYMAGVPIEILSKVVAGHATILMTLKYTKFEPVHVNEILTKANLQAITTARENFPDLIKGASLEKAMAMTSHIREDGIRQMKGAYDEPSLWARFDIGICPNGGALCGVGGPPVAGSGRKTKHAPVPGGDRNCVRCRFFVTGLPFLVPLWAHANAIFARIDKVARKMEVTHAEGQVLKDERKQLNEGGKGAPHTLGKRIRQLDEMWMADAAVRDHFLADAEATMMLIEKIRFASGTDDDGSGLPMLLPEEGIPDVVGRESTRFELIDAVVQASRWFPSISDASMEAERDGYLDRILYRNGYAPITLAPLSEAERRRAADGLASLLLAELRAIETQNLIDGRKTLADYGGLQERLETAASNAVGRPLERLALPRPVRPPMIEAGPGDAS